MISRRQRSTSRPTSLPKIDVLFGESAAGLALSGDSGSGKSNLMLVLMQALTDQGVGLTLIDPHGDLAADMERRFQQ